MLRYKVILAACFLSLVTSATTLSLNEDYHQQMNDLIEQYSNDDDNMQANESMYEQLLTLAEHPININTATREELEDLFFLTELQVENLLFYIYRFGILHSMYELQLIDGFDQYFIRLISPFISFETAEKRERDFYPIELITQGHHQVLARIDQGIQPKAAYTTLKDSNTYQGPPWYHSIRYRYHFKNKFYVSFTGEKDAGETIFKTPNAVYDFTSAAIQINHLHFIDRIVIGDYKASFGQGLVLGSMNPLSKNATPLNLIQKDNGFRRYTSSDESSYFRGLGVSFRFQNLSSHIFYSRKWLDADTLGKDTLFSFYQDGLHRTKEELNGKHTVREELVGAHLCWTTHSTQLGITGVYHVYDRPIGSSHLPYQYFLSEIDSESIGSINYRSRLKKIDLFGESAFNQRFFFSHLHGLVFSPLSQVQLVSMYRFYHPGYSFRYSNAFAETAAISNETGIYLGVEMQAVKYWRLKLYLDSFTFPWLRFTTDAPSIGEEIFLQTDYSPYKDFNMFFRIKYQNKQYSHLGDTDVSSYILSQDKASFRYQLSYSHGNLQGRNLIEYNLVDSQDGTLSTGFCISQDLSYQLEKYHLKFDLRYLLFDAVNYDNRIYVYERDVLYAFSTPMLYGIGCRYYLNLRYQINNHWTLWCKYSLTMYSDGREFIGTGLDRIEGNKRSDIRFMVQWKI